jgi:predicted nucleotidyltransferase
MTRHDFESVKKIICSFYPLTEALYLFGSALTFEPPHIGDIDIAVLLPPEEAENVGSFFLSEARVMLEKQFSIPVELVNVRKVSVVFRKEIIATGERFFTADESAADTFEMLTISFYQKLNEERKEILDDFFATKRAYNV